MLHCGDITSAGALESLAEIAPVYATRNHDDPPIAPPTLSDGPRVLNLGGVRIGLIFSLPEEARSTTGAASLFGGPVAACVYGGTHEAHVGAPDGVLASSIRSPSLAEDPLPRR